MADTASKLESAPSFAPSRSTTCRYFAPCAAKPRAAAGFSYKVPHIGWNSLHLVRPENPLMANTREGDFVYFVHSFYVKGCGDALVAGAEYGVTVPGAVARGNVYGCQFHPEKSGEAGLRILRAFAAL